MSATIRFIHAADVHFGTPFRGLCDVAPEWALRLQEAVAHAWDRVIREAIERRVDFVVLSGDAFDSSRPSYGDYLRFFEGLDRLHEAGIPAYLVAGNHDPYTAWGREGSRLPESAVMLGVDGPGFALFSREGEPLCLIGGRSYYNQAWAEDDPISAGITRGAAVRALVGDNPQAARAPFAIGVVHAALVPDQSKAQVKLDDLLAADIDYWACGHIHERCTYANDDDPRVVFPGCLQGRGMMEPGERGCYLVQLQETAPGACVEAEAESETEADVEAEAPPGAVARSSHVHVEFIPTSSVVFQELKIEVGACQTLADVRRLVQAELFHENAKTHCDEMIARITLTGETVLHAFLVKPEIIGDLRQQINNAYPSFYCDALVDQTTPAGGDSRAGASNGYFPEIVSAMAEEQRCRDDVLVNYVQSEFVKRGIPVPSSLSEGMGCFTDQAERLVLDLLRGGSE